MGFVISFIFAVIAYYIIRRAVSEGVYNGLLEYDKYKNGDKENK